MLIDNIVRVPDLIQVEKENNFASLIPEGNYASDSEVEVGFEIKNGTLRIYSSADDIPIKFISFRWNCHIASNSKIMCDAWERGYDEFEWKGIDADRNMPWYFVANSGEVTCGVGVRVRPSAMCSWRVDGEGITLICDVRNGSHGVVLKDRCLNVCTIVQREYNGLSPFEVTKEFCKLMCDDGIFAKKPVYGFNNWYYAYGNSSAEEIMSDTRYLASMTKGLGNRPYMVIDDCWEIEHCSGPWKTGNDKFPDMKGLVDFIKSQDCKAGIWIRLLRNKDADITDNMRFDKRHRALYDEATSDGVWLEDILDPSVPETIEYIKQDIKRMVDWGFTLIKHDFSTFDIFGKYGKDMTYDITKGDWAFRDEHHTTAEIIVNMYKAILEATEGKAVIIGCNTIGHLSAGLVHSSRIGDDTSGLYWGRTRRYGINSLAFRLCQNGIFYDIDGDCVGITNKIPWSLNSQWLHLLSHSGSPLFVSVKNGVLTEEQEEEIKTAFATNSVQKDTMIPLDWMYNKTPQEWLINGEKINYNWIDKTIVETTIEKTKFC